MCVVETAPFWGLGEGFRFFTLSITIVAGLRALSEPKNKLELLEKRFRGNSIKIKNINGFNWRNVSKNNYKASLTH